MGRGVESDEERRTKLDKIRKGCPKLNRKRLKVIFDGLCSGYD